MALKKSEKRLLLVLGVVVAVFVINQIMSGGKKKEAAQKGGVSAKVEKTISSPKTENESTGKKEVNKKKVTYDSWGRDPFIIQRASSQQSIGAATTRAAIDSSLQLNGIIRKGRKVYALINDQIIGIGEEKDGIRIEKIEGKEVVCVKNGVRITLLLKG